MHSRRVKKYERAEKKKTKKEIAMGAKRKRIIKEVAKKIQKPVVVYFILFLCSILLFFASYFYKEMVFMAASLIMIFFSLMGHRRFKFKIKIKMPEKVKKKEIKKRVVVAEKKKDLKMVVEKTPEKKETYKWIAVHKKKIIVFCFILFLLSIILFWIGYFYINKLIGRLSLIFMFIALVGYLVLKDKKKPQKAGIIPKHKETKIMFSGLSEKSKEISKEKPAKKMPLVKELPKGLKIQLSGHETDLDVLYKIVEQKNRVKLSALSKYFSVDKKKVEEWATILEEHKLVKIFYPAVGELEIRKWETK